MGFLEQKGRKPGSIPYRKAYSHDVVKGNKKNGWSGEKNNR